MVLIVNGEEKENDIRATEEQIINSQMGAIAKAMQRAFPGIAFAVILFPNKDNGHTAYVSNADRPTMIKAIKSWLKGVEKTMQ